jgi:hypothetical protein
MKRRDFFKGIFGAAVVAAIPKSVMEQIEATPIPEAKSIAKGGVINLKNPETAHFATFGKQILYIYDEDNFLGWSTDFNLRFCNEACEVYYLDYTEMLSGLKSWEINARYLKLKNYDNWVFHEKKLKCIIRYENMVLQGDTWCVQHTTTIPCDDLPSVDVIFAGAGRLTIILEKDDNTKPKIKVRATKRATSTDREIPDYPADYPNT